MKLGYRPGPCPARSGTGRRRPVRAFVRRDEASAERVAATPRVPRGYSERPGAARASWIFREAGCRAWIFREAGSRRRRECLVDRPARLVLAASGCWRPRGEDRTRGDEFRPGGPRGSAPRSGGRARRRRDPRSRGGGGPAAPASGRGDPLDDPRGSRGAAAATSRMFFVSRAHPGPRTIRETSAASPRLRPQTIRVPPPRRRRERTPT